MAEQGAVGTSYGGWLADEIGRRFFDWLDQPVQRVTGGVASPSISKVLERAAIAQSAEVVSALTRMTEACPGPVSGACPRWPRVAPPPSCTSGRWPSEPSSRPPTCSPP